MEKIGGTFLMLTTVFVFAQAQEGFDIYKMRTEKDADIVLDILKSALRLSAPEYLQLHEIVYGSAHNQSEILENQTAMTAPEIQNMVIRQAGHIEGNLENIIGKERFKTYLRLKPAIEQQVQAKKKD